MLFTLFARMDDHGWGGGGEGGGGTQTQYNKTPSGKGLITWQIFTAASRPVWVLFEWYGCLKKIFVTFFNACFMKKLNEIFYKNFSTSETTFFFKKQIFFPSSTGLQINFQNLSDMMSGKSKIPLDIHENLSDINFCVFKKSNKIQLLLRNISPLVYKSWIYTVCY